ncbi:putative protein OS=Streptomyces aurantiogriseus OX=66870 GN=GCM10010251_36980 PE=4 SV=1 [Streptomyces aurantiogriseus]|uniref:Uncharacterized protein n=1 Tax=Streptomyces aurantiogriseus TaxID=66870 RepID=A0A918CDK1_9ACTN|nr:hypothetical protein GCM10010251_36980 [Streptomyces aurantiogriseus]
MRTSLLELARHDRAALRCGCGQSGAHLTETFAKLLGARSAQETIGHLLDNHLEVQSFVDADKDRLECYRSALAARLG